LEAVESNEAKLNLVLLLVVPAVLDLIPPLFDAAAEAAKEAARRLHAQWMWFETMVDGLILDANSLRFRLRELIMFDGDDEDWDMMMFAADRVGQGGGGVGLGVGRVDQVVAAMADGCESNLASLV
jgi:hypothetical protein